MNKLTAAPNVSITTESHILRSIDLEFDFELCHSQYSYYSCWH